MAYRAAWRSAVLIAAATAAACNGPSEGQTDNTLENAAAASRPAEAVAPVATRLPAQEAKTARRVEGDDFGRFQVRHHAKASHYAGLAFQNSIATQVLFQMHRSEKVAEAREARKKRVTVRPPRGINQRGFVDHNRSLRRHAFDTPWFADLKSKGRAGVEDVATAVGRQTLPHDERVELLRLLHALARKADATSKKIARDAFLAYALRSHDPKAIDFSPHLAFAYYARLETVARTRIDNGTRFTQSPHAPIPPQVARRMYSADTYDAIRLPRTLSLSTPVVSR